MAFILLHAKLQFPSISIVDVRAVDMINKAGLMLPPYEAWCPVLTHPLVHCAELLRDNSVRSTTGKCL